VRISRYRSGYLELTFSADQQHLSLEKEGHRQLRERSKARKSACRKERESTLCTAAKERWIRPSWVIRVDQIRGESFAMTVIL
jgi:hypothetical protein